MTEPWKLGQRAAFLLLGAVVALGSLVSLTASALAADPVAASGGAGNAADEKAIRATADAFVKAFNAGDAKGIGALWATDAEYTDESGKSLHGRADIEKEYAELFKAQRGLTMTVAVDSIRFLGPDIAIEKGIAKVKSAAEKTDSAARYTVVHAKRDGKWVMVVGRDAPYVSASNEDYLNDLEWLIGQWRPDAKDSPLRIKFEWMAQRNFIKNTYITLKDGKESMTGAQIIGWNPKLGRIVSWHFDAQGGFGDDVWTKDGAKWVIDASGVFRNGSESVAVNVLTPIDANSFTWQSLKRTLDGVVLPNTAPVKMIKVQAAQ
ncbi:MAG: SgcJ/EcaC family oxidoreductase [Planctomycetes bacterium]|nr:SgcJ/EcaC family oxidoreductase [Planctomycetota bacterium]